MMIDILKNTTNSKTDSERDSVRKRRVDDERKTDTVQPKPINPKRSTNAESKQRVGKSKNDDEKKTRDMNCYTCGIKFKTEREKADHMKSYHEDIFHCYKCGLKFKSEKYRVDHVNKNHVVDVRPV